MDTAGDDIVGAWQRERERGGNSAGGEEEKPDEDCGGERGAGYRGAVA